MVSKWLVPGLLLVALSAHTAAAAPLTCAMFRDRLNGALLAGGANADAVTFKPGFADPTRGTRYDWTETDTEGTLSCGPADQFEEFGVQLHFTDRNAVANGLKRFVALQSASICTLVSDGPGPCANYGRAMLDEALQEMGRAFNRGARSPSGLSDRTLFAGTQAELTSAPSLITFLLGPGRGSSVEDVSRILPTLPKPPTDAGQAPG